MPLKRRRGRSTTRTAQRKRDAFLAAYRKIGVITTAAEAAGIHRRSHFLWMKNSEAYRKSFEEAEDAATEVLEREAWLRATVGREEDVWHGGQKVGTVRKPSDLLLIFLLKSKRPDVYRERYDARLTANLNVATAVKVVHEYYDSTPAIEAVQLQESQPNRALLTSTTTELPLSDHMSDGADMVTAISPVTKPADG
jgi:hypothetical protein